MSNENKKWINSFFAKKTWSEGDQFLISLGIKKEEAIRELQALQANENGFINLTLGTKKNDARSLSTWVDDYKKGSKSPSADYKRSKPSGYSPTPPGNESDDLPF